MRYHIDTIPVWDAINKHSECPLCLLRRKTEHLLADRYLGASVMESDTRIQVNRKGFCPQHHQMLYARQNRLGHALMLHSHLKELRERLGESFPGNGAKMAGRGFFSRQKASDSSANDDLNRLARGCVLCDALHESMCRYAYSILHLYKTDESFRKALEASKGCCLPDTQVLLNVAHDILRGEQLQRFQSLLYRLLSENLERLEEEIEWFTLKFDYRNADKPWGESKDALERLVQKLRGWSVGKDPGLDA